MICEKKYESKGLVMILGLTFVINIFGKFGAYHMFEKLLEKIAFMVYIKLNQHKAFDG